MIYTIKQDKNEDSLTVWGKPKTLSGRRVQKLDRKVREKLDNEMKIRQQKRPLVYWSQDEHERFLEAVKQGLCNDYEKMHVHIQTKQIQQVIDYKSNYLRKLKNKPDHPEIEYLKYFSVENKKQNKEEA